MASEAPAKAAAGASFAGDTAAGASCAGAAAAEGAAGASASVFSDFSLSFICLRYCLVGSTDGGFASMSAMTDANTGEAGGLTRRSPDRHSSMLTRQDN